MTSKKAMFTPEVLDALAVMLRRYHDEQGRDWQETYNNAKAEGVDETLEEHIRAECLALVEEENGGPDWGVDEWFINSIVNCYGNDHYPLDCERYKSDLDPEELRQAREIQAAVDGTSLLVTKIRGKWYFHSLDEWSIDKDDPGMSYEEVMGTIETMTKKVNLDRP